MRLFVVTNRSTTPLLPCRPSSPIAGHSRLSMQPHQPHHDNNDTITASCLRFGKIHLAVEIKVGDGDLRRGVGLCLRTSRRIAQGVKGGAVRDTAALGRRGLRAIAHNDQRVCPSAKRVSGLAKKKSFLKWGPFVQAVCNARILSTLT